MRRLAVSMCVWMTILAPTASQPARQTSGAAHPQVTKEQFEQWKKELSNWGRWGKDDELGALNLITPAKRKQAAQLVKEGVTVSLAHDVMQEAAPEGTSAYGPSRLD